MSSTIGLPAETSELESKSTYVNLFTNKHMTIEFLLNALNKKQPNILLSCIDKQSILSGLDTPQIETFNALQKEYFNLSYFINNKRKKKTIEPIALAEDIQTINIPPQTHVILLFPDASLAHYSDEEIDKFLNNLAAFASKTKTKLNLCIFGHLATSVLKPKLLTHNRTLAGLASMTALDESRFSYWIDFWSNRHGVIAAQEFVLTRQNEASLLASQHNHSPIQPLSEDKSDSERVYIVRAALGDTSKAPANMHVAESNQHLIGLLDSPRASTIIFSCSSQEEVQQLAIACYQMRVKAGSQLKIIIRETQQCLRYADEKYLLRSGVNLICPVQVPPMRFMTQVEAIQGQLLTRPIPSSLDALTKYDLSFGSKGYLRGKEFTRYCNDVISVSAQSKVNFALIKLTFLPGMQAEECLRLCHVKRDGDVVTATQKALYVLFSAIRHSDIDIALNNIFEFPVRDLFHSMRTFETQYDIDSELKYILEDEALISKEVTDLTTETQIFPEQNPAITDVSTLFAIKKTIALKG
ncbi:cellulose biosynthesis protein BcsE [Vibrio scophthalmi]|uniref:Cellulose biosynthesis protein BcsE n=1 Tax=Vibrio scophthalmi TaxID=45658 RepID=A0A1C7FGH9_9VIBR|nr:cellulose biosynthesis protein BcsE [Vibrio scophthalmi]ANU38553.1 Protein BcsE like protein [Vibrio scophthalmi]